MIVGNGKDDHVNDIAELAGAGAGETVGEELSRAVSDRYLTYALSTIMHRALPDARDGLKPVHRRILHAMRELKLSSTGAFRKSAKIAGDVMGNYHPHGDSAIYDAMVRMAQDFMLRYPLVDGQGNFGNIDGDAAAASRYTEARLSPFSEIMLKGMDEDAVSFRPNYDGTNEEPIVLPAAFPNLLANGSSGIAVGMATNVPPHNMAELIEACELLIDNPEADDEAVISRVPAPDFPTGGVLVDPPAVFGEVYRTGRGSIRIRARWSVEDTGRGNWQAVITEIPYGVQKTRLIQKLAEIVDEKKLPALGDVRDESAEDVRIVIEPKTRAVDPEALMAALFRQSDLEVKFGVNMNVLVDGRVPKVCSLRELLLIFIAHRREVLERRSRHRLERVMARLEILAGYIVAYLNLDEVIAILRGDAEPRAALMAKFALSEVQADAILNMRLRSLRRLEEMELRREQEALQAERADLVALLASESLQRSRLREEIGALRASFGPGTAGGARRSLLAEAGETPDIPVDMMVEREPVTVILSKMGWVRAARGHQALDAEVRFKDGDERHLAVHAQTTDRLLVFTAGGKVYTVAAAQLPGGRGMGEPLRLLADIAQDDEIIALDTLADGRSWVLASTAGEGFRVGAADIAAQTRTGRQVMNTGSGTRMAWALRVEGDHVAVLGSNGKMLVFPLDDLPEMARSKGVKLQKYKDGEHILDLAVITLSAGLSWKDGAGRTRSEALEDSPWHSRRAGVGRNVPHGFPRGGRIPPQTIAQAQEKI